MENELTESEKIASIPLLSAFDNMLQWKYKLTIQDVTPSNVKGYWKINKLCGGLNGGCKNPIHTCIGCNNPMYHTISYCDPLKGKDGKFQSIYKTWKAHREFLGID